MPSSPSYFDDSAMIRRVHREQVVALSGPRALLMMAAHPVAFEGFFNVTGSRDEPYERLARTAYVMDAIAWGPRAEANRLTRHVRAMHAHARGTLPVDAGPFPVGTPWAADDPALLLWILACLVDSAILVYERYVGPLTAGEREAYWKDMRVVGRLFGLRAADMPRTYAAFTEYMDNMLASGELVVTPNAREVGIDIVLSPPVPLRVRPLLELSNAITIGLLPRDIRRQYGLRWDPARALAIRGGAEYARRVVVPLLPRRLRYVTSARARHRVRNQARATA
jgi:uncharacterized protein (DUF2236 family)